MTSCREWREHLIEAVYGELTPVRRQELDAHLASCPGCAAELERLRATARRVDEALPPRPRGAELDLWNRVRPEIGSLDRPGSAPARNPASTRRLVLGYPAAALMAAALLVVGLGLGLVLRPSSPIPIAETPDVSRDRNDETELVRYLERATPLLLAVANRTEASAEAGFDADAERRLAERLAADAEHLARELESDGLRRQARLVTELRVVFQQMANLPRREYRHGIEVVQATIESRALLFQLSVEEMRHL